MIYKGKRCTANGEYLVRKMQEKHITARYLAKVLECKEETVQNWMQSRNAPFPRMLRTLSSVFGVPAEAFIKEVDNAEDETG